MSNYYTKLEDTIQNLEIFVERLNEDSWDSSAMSNSVRNTSEIIRNKLTTSINFSSKIPRPILSPQKDREPIDEFLGLKFVLLEEGQIPNPAFLEPGTLLVTINPTVKIFVVGEDGNYHTTNAEA